MEATWDGDLQSKVCYLYDYYHDDEPCKLRNLSPTRSKIKIPVDVKYITSTYQTLDKDQVSFHIQFKPSHKCSVDYYDDVFGKKYESIYPLGLYIDIPDNHGNYHKWLIVDKADHYALQFPTYQVLPCDHVFQWVYKDFKYEVPGVLRSQNSYNSGLWTDYKITSVEDQQKFIVPLNDTTEHLWYNQRMIVDAKVSTEPRAWEISKINRISPNGLIEVTLAQDSFDQHNDYVERDENNNIIGMWADYFKTIVQNETLTLTNDNHTRTNIPYYSSITYSGVKPQIKIGGSYKKFTVDFYEKDTSNKIEVIDGNWQFFIKNREDLNIESNDLSMLIQVVDKSNDLKENQIKVKFIGDSSYIGKILVVSYIDGYGVESTVEMEIVGL